jgi:Golgi SNAP receptor complex protein 2
MTVLYGVLDSEPPVRKEQWRPRCRQLSDRHTALVSDQQRLDGRVRQQRREAEEREQLVGGGQGGKRGDLVLDMEHIERERQGLNRSTRVADEIIGVGTAVLAGLADQRQTLKRTKTRLLDVFHQLGMSSNLIRMIERRIASDSMIMYAGMVLVLLVFAISYWYFKWR